MSSKQIHRITLFKVPNKADVPACLEAYTKLKQDAKKDGKPYILNVTAGAAFDHPRNEGYTLAVQTSYASKADMDYYDNECEAHKELKKVVGTKAQGPPTIVFFENALPESS